MVKVETTMQSIKVIDLYILIVGSHALLHSTSKTNAISCHYLRKLSITVTVQIILFFSLGPQCRGIEKKFLLEKNNGKIYKQKKIKRMLY